MRRLRKIWYLLKVFIEGFVLVYQYCGTALLGDLKPSCIKGAFGGGGAAGDDGNNSLPLAGEYQNRVENTAHSCHSMETQSREMV